MDEIRRIEELYNLKRSKYKEDLLTDDLDRVLFNEAVKEVICAAILNGGRKIRR